MRKRAWNEYLQGQTSSAQTGMSQPPQEDIFEWILQNRPRLEHLDADLTVPLEGCRSLGLELQMRGPARDISVFRFITDRRGIWEPHVTKFILNTLKADDTFVDAGANFGYFTILGGSRLAGKGKVIAFEPIAKHFHYCEQNVRLNRLSNITLLPFALWDSTQSMDMSPHGEQQAHMGGAHLVTGPDSRAPDSEPVSCVALDELAKSMPLDLQNWRLLKIDIEGAEPFALDGMKSLLAGFRPIIVIELNTFCLSFFDLGIASVWNRLKALDYRIMALPNEHQNEVFQHLDCPWPETGLRELASIQQLQDAATYLNERIPPCDPIDLVAVPAGASPNR